MAFHWQRSRPHLAEEVGKIGARNRTKAMSLILIPIGLFALLLVVYGVVLFRARYKRLQRKAEVRQMETLVRIAAAVRDQRQEEEKEGEGEENSED